MEPILSKQEITDLLQTIRKGDVLPQKDEAYSDQSHKQTHSDLDLFRIRNQRDNSALIPNFEIVADLLGENHALSLSNLLQRSLIINKTDVQSMSFENYLLFKENPGSIGVLNPHPMKQGALIVYDPQLSFVLLEIMLGASDKLSFLPLERKLTKMELTVVKSAMNLICSDLDNAFSPITPIATKLLKIENDHRLVSITDPEAEVIVSTYDVHIEDNVASMELVFPIAVFDPYQEAFLELLNFNPSPDKSWSDILETELSAMSATVIAQSGVIDLSLRQLMSLQVGDVLATNYDLNARLMILIEDKLSFFGTPGERNGKKTATISGVFQ